jgi:hypothetical protein
MMTRKRNKNQAGFIVTIELLLIAAILVIGLIVGMTNMRDATLAELSDLSESIGALNQSYAIDGVTNAAETAGTAGSRWDDNVDGAVDTAFTNAVGVNHDVIFQAASVSENTQSVVNMFP